MLLIVIAMVCMRKSFFMDKTLYIIRGIPGSGKSTYAKLLATEHGICYWEADMFFTNDKGEYKFDINHISDAHKWCYKHVVNDVLDGKSVIVSNTFTRYKELRDYVELGILNNYKVKIIECTGRYQNVHGVPAEKIQEMTDRFIPNESLGILHHKDIEFLTI